MCLSEHVYLARLSFQPLIEVSTLLYELYVRLSAWELLLAFNPFVDETRQFASDLKKAGKTKPRPRRRADPALWSGDVSSACPDRLQRTPATSATTPQPSNIMADSTTKESAKVSFRFCRECSNMLYPKEDRESSTLMFACRTCQFSEPATASCIWRNSLKEDIKETAGNTDDVAQDPTVGEPSDSVMEDAQYEDDVEGQEREEGDIVPELCTMCGQEILCPVCEQPSDGGIAFEIDDPDQGSLEQEQEAIEAERRERTFSGSGANLQPFS